MTRSLLQKKVGLGHERGLYTFGALLEGKK